MVSWYQAHPTHSLALIDSCSGGVDAPLIDVGGGSSVLVDHLVDRGHSDLTVIDLSATALSQSRSRLGDRADDVVWIEGDVTEHDFSRKFAVWHDRAVFHFLIDPLDRERYVNQLREAISPGGHVILATFAPDGPEQCSGLPVQRYSEHTMAEALGVSFAAVEFMYDAHRTPSGSIQSFIYGRFVHG